MKESDIIITDKDLPKKWFDDAFISIEAIKKRLNFIINLFDLDEDLNEEMINIKQATKEHNIVLPITYSIEKIINSTVLDIKSNYEFDRSYGVKNTLNEIKKINYYKW